VVEALRHVTEASTDLFGVTGSGIMLADKQNVPHYVAASAPETLGTGEVHGTGLSRAVSISTRRGASVVEHVGHSAVRIRVFVVAELGEDWADVSMAAALGGCSLRPARFPDPLISFTDTS
jgi:hypothetical protein